jgi:hypothetical protein
MNQMLTILHPGVETAAGPAAPKAASTAREPARPQLAPRLGSLKGTRLALLDNGKVNAGATLAALAKRLKERYGVAEVRTWKKRHAGATGAAVIPDLMKWSPHLALTALGD